LAWAGVHRDNIASLAGNGTLLFGVIEAMDQRVPDTGIAPNMGMI